MLKIKPLVISAVLIVALCFSACNRKVYSGAGKASAPPLPPAPKMIISSPTTIEGSSRYAVLDQLFQTMADSSSHEEIITSMMELMEMCESGEVPVTIFETSDSLTTHVSSISIRHYLQRLQDTRQYLEQIENIWYNEEGKIDSI